MPVKAPLSPPGPPSPPKGQEYALDHHLGNKSALITELFDEVNAFATSLGGDVTRRIRKLYIAYFRGKPSEMMRDARNFGHFGMGDTEYSLRNVDQLDVARRTMAQTRRDRKLGRWRRETAPPRGPLGRSPR